MQVGARPISLVPDMFGKRSIRTHSQCIHSVLHPCYNENGISDILEVKAKLANKLVMVLEAFMILRFSLPHKPYTAFHAGRSIYTVLSAGFFLLYIAYLYDIKKDSHDHVP